jgi:hypothetical protein
MQLGNNKGNHKQKVSVNKNYVKYVQTAKTADYSRSVERNPRTSDNLFKSIDRQSTQTVLTFLLPPLAVQKRHN